MEILDIYNANQVREKFVEKFIDTNSTYFLDKIKRQILFSDGFCYTGYLWDCFKKMNVESPEFCFQFIKNFEMFYVLWDIHSCDNILIPDYWKYPKDSVLKMNYIEFCSIKSTLPEDIYIFDDSFLWCVTFTHEEFDGLQFCVFCRDQSGEDQSEGKTGDKTGYGSVSCSKKL